MRCKDCGKDISPQQFKASKEALGVALCERHTRLIKKVILDNDTPIDAVHLFYALKDAGVHPMLEWWDGKKSVDIAISRVKLNIEIDRNYNSFKNGFTTVRIPHLAVKYYLDETVENILGIISGLKANIKAI